MGLNWLDSYQEDKKTQCNRNNTPWSGLRMKCSYIYSSLSKYKMFFFLFFFLLRLHAPFFIRVFSLYSPSILHPHLPLVDLLDDLLDVYPIQNPLEALWIVVNWDITVQVSFSHKCGQLIRCKAFNMVVIAFFPNISSFVVGYLPWSLSTKGMITFCTAFPRWLGSNLPQCFPKEAQLLGNYHQFVVILPCPQLVDPKTW